MNTKELAISSLLNLDLNHKIEIGALRKHLMSLVVSGSNNKSY